MRRRATRSIVCAALALGVTAAWAATPAQKCRAGKNTAAGKYAKCRHDAEARFTLEPDQTRLTADFARCAAQLEKKWTKLEQQGGAACPSRGDRTAMQEMVA